MECNVVALLAAALLMQLDCITSTNSQDSRNPGFLFDSNPGYTLSLPANMTKVKQMSTKVSSKMDCVFACVETLWCGSVNFKIRAEMDKHHICELIATDNNTSPKYLKQDGNFIHISMKKPPCEENPCLNDGKCISHENRMDYSCECKEGYEGEKCQNALYRNCEEIHNSGERRNGAYTVEADSQDPFQVHCDMTSDGGGWTLISRFSNSDTKNWMRDDGFWWYDDTTARGSTTSTSVNQDMMSPAFWSMIGNEIKITRSDDLTHTALLRTTSNCLGSRTFRSLITSYGDFRNGAAWANKQCCGSCSVVYGGQYSNTDGFSQAGCSSNIQNSNKIGFWCHSGVGDGAVMMIGGGGSACARADHGIGVTEENASGFSTRIVECDFGDIITQGSGSCQSSSYALNLWIR